MPKTAALELSVAIRCVAGPVRRDNQDHWLVSDFRDVAWSGERESRLLHPGSAGAVLAVADGMGGHRGGREAAELSLGAVVGPLADGSDGASSVAAAFEAAHGAVHGQSLRDPLLEGMGTTLTLALARAGSVTIGHVGDSRAYLGRGGELVCLTTDHSLPQQVLGLDREAASRHPSRNVLTQCIGGTDPSVCVEIVRFALCEGDVLLLCSDGLHGAAPDSDIAEAVREGSMDEAAQRLLDAAVLHGTTDNVTALVARARGGGLPPACPVLVEPVAEVVWDEEAGRPRVRAAGAGGRTA